MSKAAIIGPGANRKLSDRQFWPIVHSINCVNGVALERALLDHQARSAFILLGRLEHKINRAYEVPRLGEMSGRSQQHRRVTIVTAGVHTAGMMRGMWKVVVLLDRQRIHIGA